jgi:dTDP-4-amino-4,6-dideoxygalactose transaminase
VTTAEGGLVTTQDEALARRLRLLRSHGMTRDAALLERPSEGGWYYEQQALGFNYRMTDLQAALGSSQLRRLDSMHAARERIADRYDQSLRGLPLLLPPRLADRRSAWHLYAIEIDEQRCDASRADVFSALRTAGIGANVHYIAIHTQPYYQRLGFKRGSFPAAERYAQRAISIPLYPALTEAQQAHVVQTLSEALK